MPQYDELGVRRVWPVVKADANVARHLPDMTSEGALPEREFFWDVLATLCPDFVREIVRKANTDRNVAEGRDEAQTIVCHPDFADELRDTPFISSKSASELNTGS